LNDQLVKKLAKKHSKQAHDISEAAVLGAGIMGGGIAYQAASKGLPITVTWFTLIPKKSLLIIRRFMSKSDTLLKSLFPSSMIV
ncbi:3-hydroxyacyl-CoA dehydrogenase NAD-binding domain-containing protein, partial [Paraburkholderia sp. SIMBA_030]|uniref:3-hydroxyacyl-CoA dehydrogenase NAD-binding domain-containing protein n=1 Tax=Paraburkholderia sp. SIMBA_030 TaxID=3085773 RepID=UPI00397B6020